MHLARSTHLSRYPLFYTSNTHSTSNPVLWPDFTFYTLHTQHTPTWKNWSSASPNSMPPVYHIWYIYTLNQLHNCRREIETTASTESFSSCTFNICTPSILARSQNRHPRKEHQTLSSFLFIYRDFVLFHASLLIMYLSHSYLETNDKVRLLFMAFHPFSMCI